MHAAVSAPLTVPPRVEQCHAIMQGDPETVGASCLVIAGLACLQAVVWYRSRSSSYQRSHQASESVLPPVSPRMPLPFPVPALHFQVGKPVFIPAARPTAGAPQKEHDHGFFLGVVLRCSDSHTRVSPAPVASSRLSPNNPAGSAASPRGPMKCALSPVNDTVLCSLLPVYDTLFSPAPFAYRPLVTSPGFTAAKAILSLVG